MGPGSESAKSLPLDGQGIPSCNLLNTVLKGKDSIAVWVQNGHKCMGYNRVADGELRLAAAAQHHEKVSYRISLGREMIEIQSTVSTECVSFSHHCKVKKL